MIHWRFRMPKCRNKGCDKEARRLFCSDKCKNDHRNSRRKPVPKTRHRCVKCGKVFRGRADAKTCSLACRVSAHYYTHKDS